MAAASSLLAAPTPGTSFDPPCGQRATIPLLAGGGKLLLLATPGASCHDLRNSTCPLRPLDGLNDLYQAVKYRRHHQCDDDHGLGRGQPTAHHPQEKAVRGRRLGALRTTAGTPASRCPTLRSFLATLRFLW